MATADIEVQMIDERNPVFVENDDAAPLSRSYTKSTRLQSLHRNVIQPLSIFHLIVILLYIILVLALCIEEQGQYGTYNVILGLRVVDVVFLFMFLADMLFNILFVNGSSWFKVWMNILDFIIVIALIIVEIYSIQQCVKLTSLDYKPINDYRVSATLNVLRIGVLFNRMNRIQQLCSSVKLDRKHDKYSTNLEKALALLENLSSNYLVDPMIKNDIDFVAKMLANNNLHMPVLKKKTQHDDPSVNEINDTWVLENFSLGQNENKITKVNGDIGNHRAVAILANKVADDVDEENSGGFVTTIIKASILSEDHVKSLLIKCNDWNFDIFELERCTGGHPVLFIAYTVFNNYNLYETFKLSENVARRFFACVEAGYRIENEYHTRVHAADVMQNTYVFFQQNELRKSLLAQDILAAVIASSIHDYDHPGVNNAFLVATKSDAALLYNDRSVLENHHCAGGFFLMRQDDRNILGSLSKELATEVRETIISMVLATDMKGHFEEIGKFSAFMHEIGSKGSEYSFTLKDRHLLLRMALHTADVANPSKPIEIMTVWTERVMSEFFSQGDREKALGLTVSQFMDRTDPMAISKCQIAFITYIVQPTFEAWGKLCVNLAPTISTNLSKTLVYWKDTQKPTAPTSGKVSSRGLSTTPTSQDESSSGRERSITPIFDKVGLRRNSPNTNSLNISEDMGSLRSVQETNKEEKNSNASFTSIRPIPSIEKATTIEEEEDCDKMPEIVKPLPSTRTLTELREMTKKTVPATPKAEKKSFFGEENDTDEVKNKK